MRYRVVRSCQLNRGAGDSTRSGRLAQAGMTPSDEGTICDSCLRTCEDTIRRVGACYSIRAWDLDDFVQDAWLSVLKSLARGGYDPRRGQLTGWLHVVARNRAVTFCRRSWRQRSKIADVQLDLLQSQMVGDPVTELIRGSDIEQVRHALELLAKRLSPLGYAVLYLRRVQLHGVGEVAANLNLTRQQVRVYDHRARRKLATLLAGRGFDWHQRE